MFFYFFPNLFFASSVFILFITWSSLPWVGIIASNKNYYGVYPCALVMSGRAPLSNRNFTIMKWPFLAAKCIGVFWSLSVCNSMFSPSLSRFLTISRSPSLHAFQMSIESCKFNRVILCDHYSSINIGGYLRLKAFLTLSVFAMMNAVRPCEFFISFSLSSSASHLSKKLTALGLPL